MGTGGRSLRCLKFESGSLYFRSIIFCRKGSISQLALQCQKKDDWKSAQDVSKK
jgi:hypothetical protein